MMLIDNLKHNNVVQAEKYSTVFELWPGNDYPADTKLKHVTMETGKKYEIPKSLNSKRHQFR